MKYRSFLNFEGETIEILLYIGFYHNTCIDCSTVTSKIFPRDIRIISEQNFLSVHLCCWKQGVSLSDSVLSRAGGGIREKKKHKNFSPWAPKKFLMGAMSNIESHNYFGILCL